MKSLRGTPVPRWRKNTDVLTDRQLETLRLHRALRFHSRQLRREQDAD